MAQLCNDRMVHHERLARDQSAMPTGFAFDPNQEFLPSERRDDARMGPAPQLPSSIRRSHGGDAGSGEGRWAIGFSGNPIGSVLMCARLGLADRLGLRRRFANLCKRAAASCCNIFGGALRCSLIDDKAMHHASNTAAAHPGS